MAEVRQQINLTATGGVAKLAKCTELLSAEGINIVAACGWAEPDVGHMLLITDDNEKACAALSGQVDTCEMEDVVAAMLPNVPGAATAGLKALAEAGIEVKVMYGTTSGPGDAMIVLNTADNAKAAEILSA